MIVASNDKIKVCTTIQERRSVYLSRRKDTRKHTTAGQANNTDMWEQSKSRARELRTDVTEHRRRISRPTAGAPDSRHRNTSRRGCRSRTNPEGMGLKTKRDGRGEGRKGGAAQDRSKLETCQRRPNEVDEALAGTADRGRQVKISDDSSPRAERRGRERGQRDGDGPGGGLGTLEGEADASSRDRDSSAGQARVCKAGRRRHKLARAEKTVESHKEGGAKQGPLESVEGDGGEDGEQAGQQVAGDR